GLSRRHGGEDDQSVNPGFVRSSQDERCRQNGDRDGHRGADRTWQDPRWNMAPDVKALVLNAFTATVQFRSEFVLSETRHRDPLEGDWDDGGDANRQDKPDPFVLNACDRFSRGNRASPGEKRANEHRHSLAPDKDQAST